MVKIALPIVLAGAAIAGSSAFVHKKSSAALVRAQPDAAPGNIVTKAGSKLLDILTASPADLSAQDAEPGNDDLKIVTTLAAMGVLTEVWNSYNDVLYRQPILTKACTSLIGFSIGDTLAQKFVNKGSQFDTQRLARMAAFGFLFHGTISHFFYNKLDAVLPGTHPLTIVKKVFIDQVLWAPIFTFVYLTWMGVTSGLSPSAVGDKIKSDLVKGVVGSWSVWPLVHAIGFKFVPTEQRLLYINCIQIGYNVFLSVLGSNSGKVDNAANEAQAQVQSAQKSARAQAKRSL